MTKAETTRLWNHLMRMEDDEFEKLFKNARNARITDKFYQAAILRNLKQSSVFLETLKPRAIHARN